MDSGINSLLFLTVNCCLGHYFLAQFPKLVHSVSDVLLDHFSELNNRIYVIPRSIEYGHVKGGLRHIRRYVLKVNVLSVLFDWFLRVFLLVLTQKALHEGGFPRSHCPNKHNIEPFFLLFFRVVTPFIFEVVTGG